MYPSVPRNSKTSTNINTKNLHIKMSQLNFLKEKKNRGMGREKEKIFKEISKRNILHKGK